MIYSDFGKEIKASLERETEWEIDEFKARHKSGVCLWIANGPFFFDTHPISGSVGLFERHFLWRCYKKVNRARLRKMLSGGDL